MTPPFFFSADEIGLDRDISSDLIESDSVGNALLLVLRRICEVVGWDVGQAWLPAPGGLALRCSPAWHGDSATFEAFRSHSERHDLQRGMGMVGRAWSTRQPQWLIDVSADKTWSGGRVANVSGLCTGMAIPVIVNKQVAMVLEFLSHEKRTEDRRMLLFVTALASRLHSVIQREYAEEALHRSEDWFRASAEGSLSAFTILQAVRDQFNDVCDFKIVYTNVRGEEMMRLPRAKLLGHNILELFPPQTALFFFEQCVHVLRSGEVFEGEYSILSRENEMFWLHSQIVPLSDGIAVTSQDITQRKQMEQALSESEIRFRSMIENGSDIITILEADGRIRYESPSIERIMGYTSDELLGCNAFDYVHPEDREHIWNYFKEAIHTSGVGTPVVFRFLHKDGSWRTLEAIGNNLLDDPTVHGLIINSRDVSERAAYEKRIHEQQRDLEAANRKLQDLATTDGLTGLKNHRTFQEQAEQELRRAQRYGTPLSLAVVDVDSFKHYNDVFGHLEGDRVLQHIARLLESSSREADFVARYGGEEFVILMPNTDEAGAIELTERVRAAIENAPWEKRAITASFGVTTLVPAALAPSDTAKVATPGTLFAHADHALYHSKKNGRNRATHSRALPKGGALPDGWMHEHHSLVSSN